MDFGHAAQDVQFRDRTRAVLAAPQATGLLADLARAVPGERDERPLYRLLGAAGLLAPHWPRRYGGGGGGVRRGVIAFEELMRAGVPDTLLVNSILTVGQLILSCGRDEQRDVLLPRLARGEIFASVLYTEPGAGSDLGALTCTAEPDGTDGFRIIGTKAFNLSEHCDLGLCAVRTAPGATRYDGLSLFLVDLRAPGVRIERMPSLPDEQFTIVHLDGVAVGRADVIGAVDDGFAMLTRALAFERTGFDFALRASRWFGLAARGPEDPAEWERTGRYGARVAAARLLAWQAALSTEDDAADPTRAPVAKWYGSELAADVATWALWRYGLDAGGRLPAEIDRAYREAPGLTLAGGTSEMMLQTLAEHLVDAVAAEG
jgi:alkylation response protein AidB-like acyl-CoA dehydrogenase